jgi:hypothetical protein
MSKHTPGPWKFDSSMRVLACDDRATVICDVTGTFSNEAARADGHLIAGSPDLLEELRNLVDAVEGKRVTVGDCNAARAAIAKATGAQP